MEYYKKDICARKNKKNKIFSKPSSKELITYVDDRPGHDSRYAIDNSKITNELKWLPEETFESGIERTIEWYSKNKDWVLSVTSGEYREWIKNQYQVDQ